MLAAGAAEARTTSCSRAIRQLEATPLHSRAAIEQVGRAKSALNAGSERDCLAHAREARQLERQYASRLRNGYTGSSTARRYSGDTAADELNRRELYRHDLR
jgi:hypothetical protein